MPDEQETIDFDDLTDDESDEETDDENDDSDETDDDGDGGPITAQGRMSWGEAPRGP